MFYTHQDIFPIFWIYTILCDMIDILLCFYLYFPNLSNIEFFSCICGSSICLFGGVYVELLHIFSIGLINLFQLLNCVNLYTCIPTLCCQYDVQILFPNSHFVFLFCSIIFNLKKF